jgi:hypothetical protein
MTMTPYAVTLRFQFPAWDEKNGIRYEVRAACKSDAISYARQLATRDGHIPAAKKGRVTFRAEAWA